MTVLLGGFPNTVSSWPVEKVFLQSSFVQGMVDMAVVSEFPVKGVDVIIGNDLVLGDGTSSVLGKSFEESDNLSRVHVRCPVVAVTRSQALEDRHELDKDLDIGNLFESSDIRVSNKKKKQGRTNRKRVEPKFEENCNLDLSKGSLMIAQREDPVLKELYLQAEQENENDLSKVSYILKDKILFRRSRPILASADHNWKIVDQIMVPTKFQNFILCQAHEDALGGHFGISKTYKKISKLFFWPTLKRDVAKHCKTCHTCQIVGKPNQKIPKAPLQPIPAVEEPFTQLVVDIVGPLPKSKSGYQYLLTVIDRSTRFPEVIPVRSIKSQIILRHLMDFFSKFGLPREIQSDRGTNFTSRIFEERLKELGIRHNLSAAYHPESQGVLERLHSTLKSMLTKYCHDCPEEWDKNIPYLLFALRSAPSETLGFTPFEMVFGHSVRGPLDIIREQWDGEVSQGNLLEHILSFRAKLRQIWTWAQSNLTKSQKQMKSNYDIKAKERNFNVGDKVLVFLPIPGQLKAKFMGPAVIREKVGRLDYMVEIPGRRQKYQLCHINILKLYHEREENQIVNPVMNVVSLDEKVRKEIQTWPGDNSSIFANLDEHLNVNERQICDLKELFAEFPSLFKDIPGLVNCIEHDVVLVDNAKPVKQHPYRLNPVKAASVKEQIRYMLQNDLIEPSSSQWSSPVVVVKKENGEDRLCFDYRRLNDLTVPDCFPLPRIEDCIDRVGNAKFISKLDLLKGYWQVPLSERAKAVSAFITPEGLFECKVMPFGMRNAASTFQRLMWIVTRDLEGCVVYLDDIVIYSDTWSEHIRRLRALFIALEKAGLVVNLSKCDFGKAEVLYLGHKVGHGKVLPKQKNVEAIVKFPVPTSRKNIRQFLGLSGYYRRFVPGFSSLSAPLSDALKGKDKFLWTEDCHAAFSKIKAILSNEPILKSPDFTKPFKLMTDASDFGIGAVLIQESENGLEHPVAYYSKKLNDHQRRYSTIEKEALALVQAIQHFDIYITASSGPIRVYTDHDPLKFLAKFKNKNSRLIKWSIILQEFPLKICHIKGKDNVVADALSRNPISESE